MIGRSIALLCVLFSCVALMVAVTQAGKPVPTGGNYVPTPEFPAPDLYEFHPELGGMLDVETGLVWGYDCTLLTGSLSTYAGSDGYFAAGYAGFLLDEGFVDEASIAAQHEWRVPTLAEHQSAYANGLFVYGNKVWNLDASPEDGHQPVSYGGGPRWCSDPPTKGKLARASYFNVGTGEYGLTGVGSGIYAPILVYSLAD